MADVQAAVSTNATPPVDYDRIGKALGMGGMQKTLADDRAKVETLEPAAPKLTPPPVQPPPADPFQAFGQPAMWLAALGGLLTRHPLTSAIQSAGAVMDSVHKQDDAAAQRALSEWKINSEKRHQNGEIRTGRLQGRAIEVCDGCSCRRGRTHDFGEGIPECRVATGL